MLMAAAEIMHVDAWSLKRVEGAWPFAVYNAAEIARHWREVTARNPNYFNGTVHLLSGFAMRDGHFDGELLATNFASFLYWRESGYPDTTVVDCFGSGLLRAGDGGIILGRQSAGHINSGLTYLPGGFIDERDIGADGAVDVAVSVGREIGEEMGFPPGTFTVRPGAYVTRIGQQMSVAVEHVSQLDSAALVRMARAFIASEADPELEDAVAVHRRSDLDGIAMPEFARALVLHLLT
jgi:hypothetical protein